ncbi:MAG: UxaA family hydrolase [Oscillospiraceae bacterium]
MKQLRWIKINAADNVAVALVPLEKGEAIAVGGAPVILREDIPAGHKFALAPIREGENVIKYGAPIGHATADIAPGDWVHTHNVKTNLNDQLEYRYEPSFIPLEKQAGDSFQGYPRAKGNPGIRNEVWVIPTVGCVNAAAERLAREAHARRPGNVDGVYAFPHPYGCSQLGGDHENTQRALAGLVNHPNAGAVLVLGLGCENNNIPEFQKVLGRVDPERVKFLSAQSVGDEFAEGEKLLEELMAFADRAECRACDISGLVVGLKCGGSDGLSGITANPLVGLFSDRLVAAGGTTILTEVPEMFGAETLLMDRAESREVFDATVGMINGFKAYFQESGQPIYENPSPGNKEGGITTLEDKSLGCTQKGGSAPVVDVLDYGQPAVKKGLNLLYSPGNDLVASTALAVSGAQIVLFTTGRGTPFGSPVPTVKISSNSPLAERKPHWIDFDAGKAVTGTSLEALSGELYDYVVQVASGKETNTERQGIRDLAVFKTGVTL